MTKASTRRSASNAPAPSPAQIQVTGDVTRWYLARYFRTPHDPGVVERFCEVARVGHFAVSRAALAAGDTDALFRLLVATAMFQRRQDVQVQRILRGIGPSDASELTSAARLLRLADEGPCALARVNDDLIAACDLEKHPVTKLGRCSANPSAACHLKRHTVLLKRYGHFGNVPTSAALMVREAGAPDLGALRDAVLRRHRRRHARAIALEAALSKAWRISEKIAAMFLSAIANPDLSPGVAPWAAGLDWTRFVVIDSNVDLFLASIRYRGAGTYDARRAYIRALADEIDIRTIDRRVHSYNPRLVQQAMFVFMSAANRRAVGADCMHEGGAPCATCPAALQLRCPVRPVPAAAKARPGSPPAMLPRVKCITSSR